MSDATATRAERIEAATTVDSGNRRRYRGQGRRGAPNNAQLAAAEAKDLRNAHLLVARGMEALAAWHAPDVQALPCIQRRARRDEALSLLDRASRQLEAVLEKYRFGQDATMRLERSHAMRRHG